MDVKYDEYFMVNNVKQNTKYARFESDYVKNNKTERKAEIIEFNYNGSSLKLNYKDKQRVVN